MNQISKWHRILILCHLLLKSSKFIRWTSDYYKIVDLLGDAGPGLHNNKTIHEVIFRWYSKIGTQYRYKLFYIRDVSDEKQYDEMFKKQCVELGFWCK